MGKMKNLLAVAGNVDLDLEVLEFLIDAGLGESVWLVQRGQKYYLFRPPVIPVFPVSR